MKPPSLTRACRVAGALLLAMGVAGCSLFGGDTKSADTKPAPGANKPYPNLASVPPKKPDTTTPRQRMKIQEGLLADRKNARHFNGPVPGQTEVPQRKTATSKVQPVVIEPGSAAQVAARRHPAKIDGVRIVRSGLVSMITFAKDSKALPPGSGLTIVRIAQLQGATKGTLTIIGQGPTRATALARARAIANGLINLGVQGSKLHISGAVSRRHRAEVFISGGKVPRRPRP
jgi:outer membrane protein OmpA-like peptidoglycan-associated protein